MTEWEKKKLAQQDEDLLRECWMALNQVEKTSLIGGKYADTYRLAAALEKRLSNNKEKEDTGHK